MNEICTTHPDTQVPGTNLNKNLYQRLDEVIIDLEEKKCTFQKVEYCGLELKIEKETGPVPKADLRYKGYGVTVLNKKLKERRK